MRIGLVNPYSLDVPGGVQSHVLELAEYLITEGHHVSLLTPAEADTHLPPFAVNVGRAIPVRYNGSVARLAFGPAVAARVRTWVDHGNFDVVHIHEPASPSASLLALWAVDGPIVATFHSSQMKSRSLRVAAPMLQPGLDKISGRIAVSSRAKATVSTQLGGDCVVIPNGVDVARFGPSRAHISPTTQTAPDDRLGSSGPRIVFLGRISEPRKGLEVLLKAVPEILRVHPEARVLIAGPGEAREFTKNLSPVVAAACDFLGAVSESDKVALLRGADVYVAPNLGGESFGIILVEAMAAGVPVVASDLVAFTEVLDGGTSGILFQRGNSVALAHAVLNLLASPERLSRLRASGPRRAQRFDWSRVGRDIEAVYDSVRPVGSSVRRHRSSLRRTWRGAPWIR